jgi:predicted component of viral defense system (DUF524 family)
MKAVPNIEIQLDSIQAGLRIWIEPRKPETLFDAEENAFDNHEARFQLSEGCYYDFEISDPDFILFDSGENIIQQHKRKSNLGTIAPNIYVGTLNLPLLRKSTQQECCKIQLEVQSIKSGYRDDYRDMLELITEKCTDLLLQVNSPISQTFEIDYIKDSQTLYQRFAFIKSVVGTEEFSEAIHRIVISPATKWATTTKEKDIRNIRKLTCSNIREIQKGSKRTKLPVNHYLKNFEVDTVPDKITSIQKTDSVDTPENRFIKHALENFLKFCTDVNYKAKTFKHKQTIAESEILIHELENHLHNSIFKEISRPTTLKLNSPLLQRKEGYREVLRVWLMFDLAAKLIWQGGNDIYSGGKKDIATLYEYWLFFKLLELFQSIFDIEPKEIAQLITETKDGLSLQIRKGKYTPLEGVYNSKNRKLNIRFNYNRTFSGKKNYPDSGSWTTTLRPDYTLSFWPFGISENEAEHQELIVHIHFDAKYKVANLSDFLEQNNEKDLDSEKAENRKGIYKNVDLLKMHAYKDAIRRTGGAYVLYPGDISINKIGFHEIIPGLGAFPVKPSKFDNGIEHLKKFILDVIEHFLNRSSQREKIAYRTFTTYKSPPDIENYINEPMPELFNQNRGLIPDETFVLVGFYKSKEHHQWIKKNGLYNFRIGTAYGSLVLDNETVSSKFLLLHGHGDEDSGDLWEITSSGPRVFTKENLEKKSYPKPSQNTYLVIEIQPVTHEELRNKRWNFKALKNYQSDRASSLPFSASLLELMKQKV